MLQPYLDAKQWTRNELSLDVGMQHTAIYQRATGGRRPRDTAVSNFVLFGQWHLLNDPVWGKGLVGFSFERRDTLTDATAREFSRELGVRYDTHDLGIGTRDRTALRQLWWQQQLADDQIVLTLGKLHLGSHYNRNAFAGSTSRQFISQPFSTNPARFFPSDGLGANLKITPNKHYYITAGFGDANGQNTTSGFNTIDHGDLFTAGEFALTPAINELGQGNYRFTLWHIAETNRNDDGFGFALSFDQEIGKKLGAFLRYGYSDPDLDRIEHLVVSRDSHPGSNRL